MNTNLPTVQEIQSLEMMATTASKTTFFGKHTAEEIMMLFYVARDLGLPRSVVLAKGLNIIQGSVEISARVMNILIRKHGHTLQVVSCTDMGCKIVGKRKDTGEEMTCMYTIEDAKKARLIRPGGGWEKNPSDMCFARAISRLARRLFPDCVGNCYIEGEIAERVSKEPIDAPDLSTIEVEAHIESTVDFPIPEGVDKAQVDAYFEEVSQTFEKPVEYLKMRALLDPEKFWENFHKIYPNEMLVM